MTLARKGYAHDGRVFTMHLHVTSEDAFQEDDSPGGAFQIEYGRMFGHLYEE